MQDMLVIDGLQYSNWSEALFRQMREGRPERRARDDRLP